MSSRILRWIKSDNKRLPRGAVTLKLSNRFTPTETHGRCQKRNILSCDMKQGLVFRLSRNLLCLLLSEWNNNSTTTDDRGRRQFTFTSDNWMFHRKLLHLFYWGKEAKENAELSSVKQVTLVQIRKTRGNGQWRGEAVSISVPSSTECFLFTLLDGYIIFCCVLCLVVN